MKIIIVLIAALVAGNVAHEPATGGGAAAPGSRGGAGGAMKGGGAEMRFPYRQAGLTERQAAAHLLGRFTYGAGPGQVDAVVKMGLEDWFAQQLEGNLPDDSLGQVLDRYDALKLTNEEIVNTYPRAGQVVRMAIRDGVISKDSVKVDRKEYRDVLQTYMQQKGYKREQDLFRQFINQKVLRAAYSQNQLREVLTDFWFNHFNVSITKNDCAEFIPAYERDVIRPAALGNFNALLLGTAKSPAMSYYLDNFSSSAPGDPAMQQNAFVAKAEVDAAQVQARKNRGLNENYAREVMELHTLGVDGGYTQQDVTQAARVLTGWGVYPMNENGKGIINRFSEDQLAKRGFVHEGDFFFNANRHDKGEKKVLGQTFAAGGGYEEGVRLLEMLAHHPSTAAFITRKIAVRFVSDNPPQSLLDKMAKTFREKNGDIKQVLITMVEAPEFWNADAVREKTKSPFELAIGAVRSLHGTIEQPYQLYTWVTRMGEKKYYYQAPTGFPDKGAYWINTGSLLNRMNFGLALASGRIPGVSIDLVALNNGHEPESSQAALIIYGKIILPERNLDATMKRLMPMLSDPTLAQKVDEASAKVAAPVDTMQGDEVAMDEKGGKRRESGRSESGRSESVRSESGRSIGGPVMSATAMGNPMLAQVVGIIIGSPEYQRR
jgi:uncharacterized protein (DUF1800 family)